MGDVDGAIGQCQRAILGDEWIVISRDEIESHSAGGAEVTQHIEFALRVALKARVVKFGCVAVDDEAVARADDSLERGSTRGTTGPAKMQVTQYDGLRSVTLKHGAKTRKEREWDNGESGSSECRHFCRVDSNARRVHRRARPQD